MAQKDDKAERDARLAAALRANLRRRKAVPAADPSTPAADDPADPGRSPFA
ncbi:hypothetical protein [Sphingomonas bacterium]|uniref:hypothetical protein n=1 Tax=Sphingomonas bacterium TaxID=1895847 RepID=UPI0015776D67|nr:hypothetical protein [Sphingomonas bacterium]